MCEGNWEPRRAGEVWEGGEKYYFVYDSKWRIVASMKDKGVASPNEAVNVQEAFVYHAAGFAGSGGSSYIDSVIMRDADTNFAWATASDDVLNIRTFYVQNWRSDVMAILDSDGNPLERVRYTAYGTPTSHPIADINGDGTVNATDQSQWSALVGGTSNSAVYAIPDLNADGLFPDDADTTFFDQQYTRVGAGSAFGMNKLSSVASRKGYAGYEWDNAITSWHVRHRVLDSMSGKWTRMDPLGYVDGSDLIGYVRSMPLTSTDFSGLIAVLCDRERWRAGADPYPTEPILPENTRTFSPIASVCCRPAQNTLGLFIHCELSFGPCSSLGMPSGPGTVWTSYPADYVTKGRMDNGLPCRCITATDISDCLTRNPYDARDDLPGIQPGGIPVIDNNPSIPGSNCQTNTATRMSKCCLSSDWSPSFVSDPLPACAPAIPAIIKILPHIMPPLP